MPGGGLVRVAHVNADRGIEPTRKKGAAIHVEAMRQAFGRVGASVVAFDVSDAAVLRRRLAESHEREPIDLLYERHALGAFAASEFARERGIPHVIEVNAPLAREEELYRAGGPVDDAALREREYFASAARILCVSTECARHVVSQGADPARVVVEPNAVDPELFRPRRDDRLRDTLVPRDSFVVGFHGRLRPWHNFSLLVAALEVLIAEGARVHLLALGEGDFAAELAASPVREHATLVGWKPHAEAAAVVACMDVVPLTYSPDRPCWYSPLKLSEAMAVGAVPVVPRLGDLPDAVMHGVDGLLYEAGNVRALAAAVHALLAAEDWRGWLARNARRRAEGHTWDAVARRQLGLARQRKAVS